MSHEPVEHRRKADHDDIVISDDPRPMRPSSPILDVVIRAEFQVLLVVSLYLLFAGHNQPGGGFIGGLVAAAAFTTRYVAGGSAELRRSLRAPSSAVLGVGLLVAVGTALVLLVDGGGFLEHRLLKATLPMIGEVKTTTALFFDIGVYLVVVGVIVSILEALGAPTEDDR
jgi:multisubunit Na+/H+ antiporter MnhB subunit